MADIMGLSELGMINDMRTIDVVSQNIANSNTNGYKRAIPVSKPFASQLDASIQSTVAVPEQNLIPAVATLVDNKQGVLKFTGNPLDIALEGNGFFELDTDEGIRYTRRGAFTLDVSGRLVNSDGFAVNGLNGEIRLLNGSPKIDKQGRIWNNDELLAQLKIVVFEDPSSLQRGNSGLYMAAAAGEPLADPTQGVRQGYLEASNVNVMEEMVRMMTTTRHFETTQRVISGYDQMIGEAISSIAEF